MPDSGGFDGITNAKGDPNTNEGGKTDASVRHPAQQQCTCEERLRIPNKI